MRQHANSNRPAPGKPHLAFPGRSLTCGAVFLLVLLTVSLKAAAQAAPSRILVEGRPVSLAAAVPALREGRLFVPVAPVAAELRDILELDSAAQTIQARLSHTGETRLFLRPTGEVRRDGSVLAVLAEPAAVDIALRPETQLLPVDVLSYLLDVTVQVEDDTISIRRRVQVQLVSQVRHRLPIGLNRVDYSEGLGFVGSDYGHTFRLGGRGQMYDGMATGELELSGGTNQTTFNFLRGFVSLERPSGQTWTGGDFTLGRAYRLVAAPTRGFSLEQPFGSHQLSLFGGAALSGSTVGAGQFSLRQFHTGVMGLLWSSRNLLRGGGGLGYGLGGMHFAGSDRRGSLFVQQLAYRGRRNALQLDAGFGHFRTGRAAQRRTGPDFGIDVTESFSLRQHNFILRGSRFGKSFVTPQINDSLRGREMASASWSAAVLPTLNLGASFTHTRTRLASPQSSNNYTWSASYSNPRRFLPEVSVFHTIVRGTGANQLNTFLLNLSRSIRRWRPFFAYNRLAQPTGAVQSASFGTSADLQRYGSLQVYQNVSTGGLLSGSADWSPAPLWAGRLQVSGGAGYLHQPADVTGPSLTKLATRAALWARLPAGHTVQFSFQHSGFRREFRLTVGGNIFSRPSEVSLVPVAQRRAAALASQLAGRIYQDTNLNGRFEPGVDVPLSNVRLWLDNSWLADTDPNGLYRFQQVLAGPHRLRVDYGTVPADMSPLNELERNLEIPASVEFTLDFSFIRTGAVLGLVWFDENRNGQLDPLENPAPDIRILCSCAQDALTAVDGGFAFSDLLPGDVYLSVDLQGVPPDYEVEPKRLKVKVLSGRQVTGVRFALRPRERPVEEEKLPPQQFSLQPRGL